MYKRYDKNAVNVRGGRGGNKKAKRNDDHALNDEDPNQDMVLQALPASTCCNPNHLQFASYNVNEINKSCQGIIVIPNVENGVANGRKVINRCKCLSEFEYTMMKNTFIPKNENVGEGKCFHATFFTFMLLFYNVKVSHNANT